MSKVSRLSTFVLSAALSLTAIACTGPIFIHPPAATGAAGLASASTGPFVPGPTVAAVSPWHGSEIFVVGALMIFVTLGVSMYAFRAKPE